jgi:glutaredoxin
MDFISPQSTGFTIYSKSGCPNCNKIKTLLKTTNLIHVIVECDDYIIKDKESFKTFIKELTHTQDVSFPIVFNDNKYIGGYHETTIYIDKLLISFENLYF